MSGVKLYLTTIYHHSYVNKDISVIIIPVLKNIRCLCSLPMTPPVYYMCSLDIVFSSDYKLFSFVPDLSG